MSLYWSTHTKTIPNFSLMSFYKTLKYFFYSDSFYFRYIRRVLAEKKSEKRKNRGTFYSISLSHILDNRIVTHRTRHPFVFITFSYKASLIPNLVPAVINRCKKPSSQLPSQKNVRNTIIVHYHTVMKTISKTVRHVSTKLLPIPLIRPVSLPQFQRIVHSSFA